MTSRRSSGQEGGNQMTFRATISPNKVYEFDGNRCKHNPLLEEEHVHDTWMVSEPKEWTSGTPSHPKNNTGLFIRHLNVVNVAFYPY